MSSNTVNSIINYINIVCADAAKATGRDNDVQWQFCIIKNNVIFSMKSKYIKVRSRILYRLTKNFNRKFPGFYFRFIPACTYDMRMRFDDMFDGTRGFGTYDLKEGIDPNYSFIKWDLFRVPVTIQSFQDDERISPDAGKPGAKVAKKTL